MKQVLNEIKFILPKESSLSFWLCARQCSDDPVRKFKGCLPSLLQHQTGYAVTTGSSEPGADSGAPGAWTGPACHLKQHNSQYTLQSPLHTTLVTQYCQHTPALQAKWPKEFSVSHSSYCCKNSAKQCLEKSRDSSPSCPCKTDSIYHWQVNPKTLPTVAWAGHDKKYESLKVKNHTQNASQHFFFFLPKRNLNPEIRLYFQPMHWKDWACCSCCCCSPSYPVMSCGF